MRVHREGSRAGYRDMELSIDLVEDPHLADRLGRSIQGRVALRRFKDVLADWPDLLKPGTGSLTNATAGEPEPGSPPKATSPT